MTKEHISLIVDRVDAAIDIFERHTVNSGMSLVDDIYQDLISGSQEEFEGIPEEQVKDLITVAFQGADIADYALTKQYFDWQKE